MTNYSSLRLEYVRKIMHRLRTHPKNSQRKKRTKPIFIYLNLEDDINRLTINLSKLSEKMPLYKRIKQSQNEIQT